jgi:structural maintenance of chromosome 2
MIDGRTCSQGDVHSLFQQAGLDVNNPNFLIQQGEVTKVLNSTPKDILKKIEQALGTVGYEKEKGAAITALGRKEKKVRELEDMLANEIDPKMRKLREQKSRFLEFQKTQNDLERLSRLVIAYDYVQCRDKLQKSAEDLKRKQERVEELKLDEAETEAQIQCLEEDKNKIEVERENELRKGGTVNELEEEIKAHSDQIARLSTNIECEEDTMEDESAKKSSTEKTVRMLESQLEEKQEKYERLAERHASAKNVLQRQSKEVEDQEELLQSLQTGVASKEGQRSGYQGQLHEAQKRRVDAETEEKQKMRQISHLEKQIKDDEPKARSAEQQNAKLLQKLEEEKSQVKQLKEHLSRIGIDAERESNMQQEESILQDEIRGLQQKANDSRRKITRMDFEYQDPTPNFDRSRVKGQLAELFTVKDSFLDSVKDPKKDPYTPLEVSAGTHLENVIVDNTDTSRELINHGKLKRRFNFIPLKGIKEYEPCPAKISAAQRLAPGKVNLALSLIEYHDDVRKAMEFVFGSTLVCEDGDAAKKVTFEPSIRMRSVTLAGDVYEPGGTLTGGSAAKGSGVLKALQELNRILVDLREKEKSLSDLQATMARDRESLQAARKFRQELDLKTLQVELIQKQIDGNSSSVVSRQLVPSDGPLLF